MALPDARFRVQLDTGHSIVAYTAGKMKKHRIKTLAGDRVTVEMSPYDLEKGRLVSLVQGRAGGRSAAADAARTVPAPLEARRHGHRRMAAAEIKENHEFPFYPEARAATPGQRRRHVYHRPPVGGPGRRQIEVTHLLDRKYGYRSARELRWHLAERFELPQESVQLDRI